MSTSTTRRGADSIHRHINTSLSNDNQKDVDVFGDDEDSEGSQSSYSDGPDNVDRRNSDDVVTAGENFALSKAEAMRFREAIKDYAEKCVSNEKLCQEAVTAVKKDRVAVEKIASDMGGGRSTNPTRTDCEEAVATMKMHSDDVRKNATTAKMTRMHVSESSQLSSTPQLRGFFGCFVLLRTFECPSSVLGATRRWCH